MSWWESGRNYVFIIEYEQLIWSWIALAADYYALSYKKKKNLKPKLNSFEWDSKLGNEYVIEVTNVQNNENIQSNKTY